MITRFECKVCKEIKTEIWLFDVGYDQEICKGCRMKKCAKCKDNTEAPCFITHGGKSYAFCNYCFDQMEHAPDGNFKVQDYLRMNKKEWIERNMELARENRKNGKSPWTSVDK